MGVLKAGDRFVILRGDGDQSYFGRPIHLQMIEASWFPGDIPEWGSALLFVVESGEHAGEYLALTSRHTATIEEQFVEGKFANAILHRVLGNRADTERLGIGIGLIERLHQDPSA